MRPGAIADTSLTAPWLNARVDFPLNAAPFKEKADCQGGRLVNVHDRLGAYMVFHAQNGHRVGLLVFDPSGDEDLVPRALNRRIVNGQEIYSGTGPGVSTAAFRQRGLDYVAISDLDEDSLTNAVLTNLVLASFRN